MQKDKKKKILRLNLKLLLLLFTFSGILIFLIGKSSYRMFMSAALNQNLGFESGIASYISDIVEDNYPQFLTENKEDVDINDYKELQDDIAAIKESVSMSMIAVIGFEEVEDGYSTYLVVGTGGDLDRMTYRDWIELEKIDIENAGIVIRDKTPVSYMDEEYEKSTGLKLLSVMHPIIINDKVCGISYVTLPMNNEFIMTESTKGLRNFLVGQFCMVMICLVALLLIIVQFIVVRPIQIMTKQVEDYSESYSGSAFDKKIKTNDELETLYDSFVHLSDNIRKHTTEQIERAAEEERRLTEYRMASEMRASILPEPFNKKNELYLDIDGRVVKFRTSTGDFYDWFEDPLGRIYMITASSDEVGMVAATYLVITHAVLRSYLMTDSDLKDSMTRINAQIFRNVGPDHPIRLFLGMIDPENGSFTYINCGSAPPYIMRKGARAVNLSGRVYESLGITENVSYIPERIELRQYDRIYLIDRKLDPSLAGGAAAGYPMDNLIRIMEQFESRSESVEDNLRRIESDIVNFSGGDKIEQDILIVAMKYMRPNKELAEMILTPVMNNYSQLQGFLKLQMKQNNIEGKSYAEILVASEELFALLCRYSKGGRIRSVCSVSKERAFKLEMSVTFKGGSDNADFTSQETSAMEFIKKKMDSFELTTADNRILAVIVKNA
ncbi:Stage II sporulation protein E (SpoIIE) [Lachnospiraceae bacterium]|nr:Stage II sporulation protein E (SpoIIE) [Lachnospiraceae bacterium]